MNSRPSRAPSCRRPGGPPDRRWRSPGRRLALHRDDVGATRHILGQHGARSGIDPVGIEIDGAISRSLAIYLMASTSLMASAIGTLGRLHWMRLRRNRSTAPAGPSMFAPARSHRSASNDGRHPPFARQVAPRPSGNRRVTVAPRLVAAEVTNGCVTGQRGAWRSDRSHPSNASEITRSAGCTALSDQLQTTEPTRYHMRIPLDTALSIPPTWIPTTLLSAYSTDLSTRPGELG